MADSRLLLAGLIASVTLVLRAPAGIAYEPPPAATDGASDFAGLCSTVAAEATPDGGRLVCADIAAIDQTLVYNRFGSFNPEGMIFALRRDLAPINRETEAAALLGSEDCDGLTGTEPGTAAGSVEPGSVRLRDCKRPRPLTLRANVGDRLLVRTTNLLREPPDLSQNFCRERSDDTGRAAAWDRRSVGDEHRKRHGEVDCLSRDAKADEVATEASADWPHTRGINLVVQGLTPLPLGDEPPARACSGFDEAAPGETFTCLYAIPEEGTYFFASHAAPAGGEGDGGSIVHGLFGAVVAERPGTRWYRSQVSRGAFDAVWPRQALAPADAAFVRHARSGLPDYETTDAAGVPVLNMAMPLDGTAQVDFRSAGVLELVHSDLNAIVYCDDAAFAGAPAGTVQAGLGVHACGRLATQAGSAEAGAPAPAPTVTKEPAYRAFREFSVFFHDELKTFFTRNFEELGSFGQLAGVRDGFAINYGASGMGTLLLANRKGIGPAASCAECLYEEFFLTSWANGDPALLEWYADDPSNVHHSYLNDPVVFRNFHAGPKETHVFHLHAHQWFAGNDPSRGSYLDSQTVSPQQGFTYNIYHGGFGSPGPGGWGTGGSGNRNHTVGDSIFHCHLYPHFAQGMWELWRVHDVLEDGTRKLPDGQIEPGLSLDIVEPGKLGHRRPGSVDRLTGAWIGTGDDPATPEIETSSADGTPVPAIVPLPGAPLPLLPTYANDGRLASDGTPLEVAYDEAPAMPGYPFYIAGQPGHRPPQAPLDIARKLDGSGFLDGGLGRHVVADTAAERHFGAELPPAAQAEDVNLATAMVSAPDPDDRAEARTRLEALRRQAVAKALALGDMSGHLEKAAITTLPSDGTRLERAAMGFHNDGNLHVDGTPLHLRDTDGVAIDHASGIQRGAYSSPQSPIPGTPTPAGATPRLWFAVNGAPPAPGAPFADPCGMAPDRPGAKQASDPLTGSLFGRDPFVIGFRRYEVSAVQLDLIVNRAGWHDPQARINVLSDRAPDFKEIPGSTDGRISPAIRDDEEPFFFRALSGECIEFRHRNELPKELALDDFQVKTPTDTIGQHIHLVKFDVTASDGSGNGWNYEDGTFAPDELMARRCAALRGSIAAQEGPVWWTPPTPAECDGPAALKEIWRKPWTPETAPLFQTTTQRWFADPMLTLDENGKLHDRTMRTVFTHDHFGPSSIQQHGFYSALLIEPGVEPTPGADPTTTLVSICRPSGEGCMTRDATAADPETGDPLNEVVAGSEALVGTQKRIRVRDADPIHPDYREFAISIADFAVLYDPRDRDSVSGLKTAVARTGAPEARGGMAQLLCEATWRQSPALLRDICGANATNDRPEGLSWFFPGDPPAWVAAGTPRDDIHTGSYSGDMLRAAEVFGLRGDLIAYRQAAAGMAGRPDSARTMARPVAAPLRPESISVDHHDPYLVNYRNAPIPFRIGDKVAGSATPSPDCAPKAMNRPRSVATPGTSGESDVEDALATGSFGECSIAHQMIGAAGDMAFALSSRPFDAADDRDPDEIRDPETPVFEAYQGERIVTRMIQGAQEVQHNFRIAGQPQRRNIDQSFSEGTIARATTDDFDTQSAHRLACFAAVRESRPAEYRLWLRATGGLENLDPLVGSDIDVAAWTAFEKAIAGCDNLEGYTYSQEIGISEHFEMQGSLRSDVSAVESLVDPASAPPVERPGAPYADISDYLYDFGSVDAIWNGAWGLYRIYRGADSWDPVTGAAIEDRLGAALPGAEESNLAESGVLPEGTPSCPLPTEGRPLQTVEAVIVALAAGDVWQQGIDYGGGRHDPDGLMLALLPPEDLVDGGFAPDMTGWTPAQVAAFAEAWNRIPRQKVVDAVAARYGDRPEPFVLRANAGDCLWLRYVNLLRPVASGGIEGIQDLLGDALAPKITPLNLDPIREAEEDVGDTGRLVRPAGAEGGVRPSAGLALSIGLPSGELIRNLPIAYGLNQSAMAGSNDETVKASQIYPYYAGRMVFAPARNQPDDLIQIVLQERMQKPDPAVSVSHARAEDRTPVARLLGEDYVVSVERPGEPQSFLTGDTGPEAAVAMFCGTAPAAGCADAAEGFAARLREEVAALLDESTHWIPYAFGAAPVRATGDVISHATSGMFGVIDVVPQTWPLADAPGMTNLSSQWDHVERRSVAFAQRGFGTPIAFRVPETLEDGATTIPLREFVLFTQDGLGLRDPGTGLDWRWDDGTPISGAADFTPGCRICDDSYDFGQQGVSYRSPAYYLKLREGGETLEANTDLNAKLFPADFFDGAPAGADTTLKACPGETVVIRVVHPGGRARQHTFAMGGYDYNDLFPGFGFPHSALIGPGKSVTAWLSPKMVEGKALWLDGPRFLASGGIWGTLDVQADPDLCAG